MRYFLIKDGSTVVRKNVYAGDDSIADALVSKDAGKLKIEEVDQPTFDSSIMIPQATADQTAWQAAKSTSVAQALVFIAKKLGLE